MINSCSEFNSLLECDTPIEALRLNSALYNILKRNDIHTVGDIAKLINNDELSDLHGLGKVKCEAILQKMNDFINFGVDECVNEEPVNEVTENFQIHESNYELSIETFRTFGLTPRLFRTLTLHGVAKTGDLVNIGPTGLQEMLRGIDYDKTIKIIEIFREPFMEVFMKALERLASEDQFEIYIKRAQGQTLAEVGDDCGLTRERVRQICVKFSRKIGEWTDLFFRIVSQGRGYLKESEIQQSFENQNFGIAVVEALRQGANYDYLDCAEAFIDANIVPKAEKRLTEIASEIVGDGINLFENLNVIDDRLCHEGLAFISCDEFMDLLIQKGYKFYGDFVVKSKKSYGFLAEAIVATSFPEGIHTDSKEEVKELRALMKSNYGPLKLPDNDRSFMTRVCAYLVQCGKSTYISPRNIEVDKDILGEIKEYIDQREEKIIYYNEVFSEHEGLLMMTSNIDNAYFLHGILGYYFPGDYMYSRDFLEKPEGKQDSSWSERIERFLAERKCAATRKEIKSELVGMTDVMLNNAVYTSKTLISWGNGSFNSTNNLTITQYDRGKIKDVLDSILARNLGYCSANMLYAEMGIKYLGWMEKNKINDAQSLYYVAEYILSREYEFRCPHIAEFKKFPSMNAKDIAYVLLGGNESLSSKDFWKMANHLMWPEVTAGGVLTELEKEYIRIDQENYIRRDSFELSELDKEKIRKLIEEYAAEKWYLPLTNFVGCEEYLDGGYQLNEFLIREVIPEVTHEWNIVDPQYRDRRYQKGIMVRKETEIEEYDQIIAHILRDAGIKEIEEAELLSYLQLNGLAYKTISKELYLSEMLRFKDGYFTVVGS